MPDAKDGQAKSISSTAHAHPNLMVSTPGLEPEWPVAGPHGEARSTNAKNRCMKSVGIVSSRIIGSAVQLPSLVQSQSGNHDADGCRCHQSDFQTERQPCEHGPSQRRDSQARQDNLDCWRCQSMRSVHARPGSVERIADQDEFLGIVRPALGAAKVSDAAERVAARHAAIERRVRDPSWLARVVRQVAPQLRLTPRAVLRCASRCSAASPPSSGRRRRGRG